MSEETKIVKAEQKKNNDKNGSSNVQIRAVDKAIIDAQMRERAKAAAAKKEAAKKEPGQTPATKPAAKTGSAAATKPASSMGKPMPKSSSTGFGTPMPKSASSSLGKPMPKGAVPQKKADSKQPVKEEKIEETVEIKETQATAEALKKETVTEAKPVKEVKKVKSAEETAVKSAEENKKTQTETAKAIDEAAKSAETPKAEKKTAKKAAETKEAETVQEENTEKAPKAETKKTSKVSEKIVKKEETKDSEIKSEKKSDTASDASEKTEKNEPKSQEKAAAPEKAEKAEAVKPVEKKSEEKKSEEKAAEKKPVEKAPEKKADEKSEVKTEEKKPEDKKDEKKEEKKDEKAAKPDLSEFIPNIGVKIIRRAADEPAPVKPKKPEKKQGDNRKNDSRRDGRGGDSRDGRSDNKDNRDNRDNRQGRDRRDGQGRPGQNAQGGQDRKPKEYVGKKDAAAKDQSPRKKQTPKTDAKGEKVVAYTAPTGGDNRGRKSKDKDREKDNRGKGKYANEDIPTDLTRNIKKKHSKYKETKVEEVEVLSQEVEEAIATGGVVINVPITVAGFCEQVEKTTSQAIMALMKMGIMANVNQNLDEATAVLLGMELGVNVAVKKVEEVEVEEGIDNREDRDSELQPRPPIITVMGHVDHGKTSILDAIRSTNVTAGEAGGITQHIGASEVMCNGQKIVFLDTPGHEAFTAMRARGAYITDIAVLVVAADDSVMPQTIESISHAKAAGVPIIVAMNKMDKPSANPDLVKKDLADQGLLVEDWGGDVICVPCSAKTGMGIQQLLEMILLQAEMLELKANPNRLASGTVIEARLDKTRGPVATLLVMNGTLQAGSAVVAGIASGRIRVMTNPKGDIIRKAGPASAVEITGLTEVPEAGDEFYMVKDDKTAREIAERRKEKMRTEVMAKSSAMSLEKLFGQLQEGETKDLNLIIKADVQGSVGALEQSLEKLHNENVRVKIIHTGVGAVTESDVMLAGTSDAVIIGFNVRPSSAVQAMADSEGVEIRCYRVIYEIIDDIEAAMKGMLNPVFKEVILGKIEVRNTFKVPNVGIIAGGYVLEGKVVRGAQLRLVRDGIVIHEGNISSLRRFKDDVKEVATGYECGIGIEKYNDIKEGDIIEAYKMEEVARD